MFNILSSGLEGAKELGVFIFPIYSLFNGEPRSYLEFPNHQIVLTIYFLDANLTHSHGRILEMTGVEARGRVWFEDLC